MASETQCQQSAVRSVPTPARSKPSQQHLTPPVSASRPKGGRGQRSARGQATLPFPSQNRHHCRHHCHHCKKGPGLRVRRALLNTLLCLVDHCRHRCHHCRKGPGPRLAHGFAHGRTLHLRNSDSMRPDRANHHTDGTPQAQSPPEAIRCRRRCCSRRFRRRSPNPHEEFPQELANPFAPKPHTMEIKTTNRRRLQWRKRLPCAPACRQSQVAEEASGKKTWSQLEASRSDCSPLKCGVQTGNREIDLNQCTQQTCQTNAPCDPSHQ